MDDLLATGGTIIAANKLIKKAGGVSVASIVLYEILDLKGREKIK